MSRIDAVRANLASIDRVEERLFGHANTHDEAMASFEHLNCPACGGSGHVEDVAANIGRTQLRNEQQRLTIEHQRQEIGKLHARVRVLEGERDQARELADQADGYLRRAEIAEGERDDARERHADVVRSLAWVQEAFERREISITHWGERLGDGARQWVDDLKTDLATAEKRAEAFRETILEYAGQLTDAIEQRDAALKQLGKAEDAMLGNATQRDDARAERDAAAENARRERDRHGTYDAETLAAAGEQLGRNAVTLGTGMLTASGGEATRYRAHFVESILRAAGLVSQREQKPRCRVVTSPRFYSEEERQQAAADIATMAVSIGMSGPPGWRPTVVDVVAEALGLRRSAK